jgi:hypothetical protein
MAQSSGQTDVLRALGRFLDAEGATHVEIVNHETYLAVSWEKQPPGAEQRSYMEHDLEELRAQARDMRQADDGNPSGSLAELLRTLGQEIDNEEIDVNMIVQEEGGFLVSGVAGGRYVRQLYETEELLSSASQRRIERAQRNPSPSA